MCSSTALRVRPCLQVDEGSHWGALTSTGSICLGASKSGALNLTCWLCRWFPSKGLLKGGAGCAAVKLYAYPLLPPHSIPLCCR